MSLTSPNYKLQSYCLSIQIPRESVESFDIDSETKSVGTSRRSSSSEGSVGSPTLDGSMFRPNSFPSQWRCEDWILNPGRWNHFQDQVRRFYPGITIYPVLGYEDAYLKTIVFWGENRNSFRRGDPDNHLHLGMAIRMLEQCEVTFWHPIPLQHFKDAFNRSDGYHRGSPEFHPYPFYDVPATDNSPSRRIII